MLLELISPYLHTEFVTSVITDVALGLFIAVAPLVDPDTSTVWAQYGLAGVVVGVTLYRDWKRETRMNAEREANQKWIQETLLTALEKNSAALSQMAKSSGERPKVQ